jgi:glucan phosphorylase
MQAFNRGDYQESVEAKRKADAIVSVLYPNDATPEGKLLRLEQQYFFVSASIQVCVHQASSYTDCITCSYSLLAPPEQLFQAHQDCMNAGCACSICGEAWY